MSKNGIVTVGKWEYLVGTKSLLLDRVSDKILCKEAFIDEDIMILKLDGTDNKYFALANEITLPDLNIMPYLQRLKDIKLHVRRLELDNGSTIGIQREHDYAAISVGDPVFCQDDIAGDGTYSVKGKNIKLIVKDGVLEKFLYMRKLFTSDGIELAIEAQRDDRLIDGDKVTIDGREAPDGNYKIGFLKYLKIKDGEVIL